MGVKSFVKKVGQKAGDTIAKLAVLSPAQVESIENQRNLYLEEMPAPNDPQAEEMTERLLAAGSVEIFNAYLPQLRGLYVPIEHRAEYDGNFNRAYNIRFFNITKWVTDKKEKNLEKLINVYEVLSNEQCNIALVFHRSCEKTDVYLAVTNTENADSNDEVENYATRLRHAIQGNFPGSEYSGQVGRGVLPFLDNDDKYSVAVASNIPAEKSREYISQTIEKLLDGIVPKCAKEEYTVILLATPILDIEERKLRLGEIYSALKPYMAWNTQFTLTESGSEGSSATFGLNVGASAGVQNGTNAAVTNTAGTTDSVSQSKGATEGTSKSTAEGTAQTNTEGDTTATGTSHTDGTSTNEATTDSLGGSVGFDFGDLPGPNGSVNYSHGKTAGTGTNAADTVSKTISRAKSIADTTSKTVSTAKQVSNTLTNTLGKAVNKSASVMNGVSKATNFGANFGANFARTSNVTATIGKNESISQSFENYNVKHAMELLEEQMKRYEQCTALGMWDFAAYVLSEDQNIAANVAHSYIALTEGEKSYMSKAATNLWRGDVADAEGKSAAEICGYLRELRHPLFGLNQNMLAVEPTFYVYPPVVTATTALSGKELALSLNFPQKSIAGLPVLECAEFGRNITTYDVLREDGKKMHLGHIYHMHHDEPTRVSLSANSLASHTFVTGSTGAGKSNTIYQILQEARRNSIPFLVIEPAKGEYKDVFGNKKDVSVYGTNKGLTPLLRINPFSFPKSIHILEHLDRLVEIFNVCWPMYAAMPAVLKNAIEKAYEDCGWNLTESENPYDDNFYPTFADVARNIKSIMESSEYDADSKGAYKGALLTRLQSLTNGINGLIFTDAEIAGADLFDKNVIVDLSRVGSSETKSLMMGMLILKLQEYRMDRKNGSNKELMHLTVLEEAHNILKRSTSGNSGEGGNLAGKSVEMIANAIAEMRTYGEGFIIADQAPALLDMAAIRNTNTKIIMRLPDYADRELVGKAANLNEDQIQELAKLPCGVAAIYQNEWVQPVLCKVDRYTKGEGSFVYTPVQEDEAFVETKDRLEIAELLCNGVRVKEPSVLSDLQRKMDAMGFSAFEKVTALNLLGTSSTAPRMTKLAPVLARLFPEVESAVKEAYHDTREMEEWTNAAEETLRNLTNERIHEQIRRDIIQGVMTHYVLQVMNDAPSLQEWAEGGFFG